jgi:hypothetical protein
MMCRRGTGLVLCSFVQTKFLWNRGETTAFLLCALVPKAPLAFGRESAPPTGP